MPAAESAQSRAPFRIWSATGGQRVGRRIAVKRGSKQAGRQTRSAREFRHEHWVATKNIRAAGKSENGSASFFIVIVPHSGGLGSMFERLRL